ncbi:SKP2-like protein 1 [Haematococcus lacustris]|uniref:SKP2-like protein 1 n=1 Tax=Haematococcus lacustris TaxID=44745 RepID=A0A699ZGD6_HAELA|nr:SKP2-like protein 1 [Haematococcus lacustris]
MLALQRLQLYGGPCLGDDEAAQLAVNCTALVSLQLQRCQALTATGVCSIIRHCPQLVELDVCGCPLVLEELVVSKAA